MLFKEDFAVTDEGTRTTPSTLCSICAELISLASCKIDEDGKAMHPHCYVTKMQLGARGLVPLKF
jgi:hypothetical protein